jgi:hypothetical protein
MYRKDKNKGLIKQQCFVLFNVLKTQLPPPLANIHYGYAIPVDKGYSPGYQYSSQNPMEHLDR